MLAVLMDQAFAEAVTPANRGTQFTPYSVPFLK